MKTPEQIAAETAKKIVPILVNDSYLSYREDAAKLILTALTEYAAQVERERDEAMASPRKAHKKWDELLARNDAQYAELTALRTRVADLESQLNDAREYGARMRRERDDWKEVAGQHCADAAKLEQQLHALRLVCGTTDANKFETALDRANARIKELELKLVALGEVAVGAWDDKTVGEVDATVKEPTRYKDMLRTLFRTNPERIKELEADLERERAERQKEVGAQEYRGNTVSYMYDKAKCYGNMVHGCTPALAAAGFPPEDFAKDGQVGAIARAVGAMAKRMAELELQTFDIKALETENAGLRMEVDSMCNAEELRQIRAHNTELVTKCGQLEADRERREHYRLLNDYPKPNGIKCPQCGVAELQDTDAAELMSYPPQRRVKCSKCNFTGTRVS